MQELLIYSGLAVLGYVSLIFLLALALRNNGIVDIAWGPGFLLIGTVELLQIEAIGPRQWLVLGMIAAWAIRLAVYIFIRSIGKAEDWRYAEWREDWGKNWVWRSFLQVFLLQGAIMWVAAAPVHITMIQGGDSLYWLDFVGAGIFLMGLLVESLGDFQLLAFKRKEENKGKIMTEGIWKYSRHPNYFGETVLWWGIGLVALSQPYGWIGLAGPVIITYLLLGLSGVPMLEKGMEKRPGWDEYARKTSAFVPWPPKS